MNEFHLEIESNYFRLLDYDFFTIAKKKNSIIASPDRGITISVNGLSNEYKCSKLS